MSTDVAQLLSAVADLPEAEFQAFYNGLSAELDRRAHFPFHESWQAEIARRVREYEAGAATAESMEVVLDRVHKKVFGHD